MQPLIFYVSRMAKNDVVETTEMAEKSEGSVHWFFAAVGLVYGCGFLVVFTFFKGFGVDSADFVEAKYIHVGVLFFMACLVVAVPLWWLVWPMRSKMPEFFTTHIRKSIIKTTWSDRGKCFIIDPTVSFFSPNWSIDTVHGLHGLHARPPVRISMILILWSFVTIVMFAPSNFGQVHTKLAIFNFLIPMALLMLGFLGDFFKGGAFSVAQNDYLRIVRCGLRVWWLLAGGSYLYCFLFTDWFNDYIWPLAIIFFYIPLATITWLFVKFFFFPNRGGNFVNFRSRIDVCLWALYSLQWATVVLQIWVFIWTVKRDTLGISLWDVLLGKNYFPLLLKHIHDRDFPHGGIYFAFLIILIGFFIIRNSYRLKQMERAGDKGHPIATSISMAAVVVPLGYISILAFAHYIYPYIPYEKGGGDYTKCPLVHLTFNTSTVSAAEFSIALPPEILSKNTSNCLIILDENSSFVFLADRTDAGGPANWQSGTNKPTVFQIRHELVNCIAYGK
jgi:hypothetical protein